VANTYSQIYIMFVFAVKDRESHISESIEKRLFPFINEVIEKRKHKLLQINGTANHIHLLVSLNPVESISDLIKAVKSISSKFINDNKMTISKFQWQRGFGAFSYSQSQLGHIISYIKNQKKHHHTKTFKEEYIELLMKFCINYDVKYIFDFFDE
jgi:putative transposase